MELKVSAYMRTSLGHGLEKNMWNSVLIGMELKILRNKIFLLQLKPLSKGKTVFLPQLREWCKG